MGYTRNAEALHDHLLACRGQEFSTSCRVSLRAAGFLSVVAGDADRDQAPSHAGDDDRHGYDEREEQDPHRPPNAGHSGESPVRLVTRKKSAAAPIEMLL